MEIVIDVVLGFFRKIGVWGCVAIVLAAILAFTLVDLKYKNHEINALNEDLVTKAGVITRLNAGVAARDKANKECTASVTAAETAAAKAASDAAMALAEAKKTSSKLYSNGARFSNPAQASADAAKDCAATVGLVNDAINLIKEGAK